MTHQLNSFVFANKRPAIFFLATTINVSHRLEKIPLMDHILITHQSHLFVSYELTSRLQEFHSKKETLSRRAQHCTLTIFLQEIRESNGGQSCVSSLRSSHDLDSSSQTSLKSSDNKLTSECTTEKRQRRKLLFCKCLCNIY